MQNKAQAFDLLNEALQDTIPGKNYNMHPAVQSLSPQDASEVHTMLQYVQMMKQAQMQVQSGMYALQQRQMELIVANTADTFNSMKELKGSLNEALVQAKKGYHYVMVMYVVVFYSGLALIATSIVFAAFGKNILAIAFGAIGLIDLVAYMLYKPPLELQASRSNFAQLTAALISWFNDLMNLNTFLTQPSRKEPFVPFSEVEQVSKQQAINTQKLMDLIEKYSEPGKKDSNKNDSGKKDE